MRVRRTAVVAAVAAGFALAGCGTGQNAQTQENRSTTSGPNADLQGGQLQVRNVYATPSTPGLTEVPVGGSLDLHFAVFNRGDRPERLVQITSPQAESVQLGGGDATGTALEIRPNTAVTVGGTDDGPLAQLRPLTVSRFTGTHVTVTLSFSGAGSTTLDVPVEESPSTTAA